MVVMFRYPLITWFRGPQCSRKPSSIGLQNRTQPSFLQSLAHTYVCHAADSIQQEALLASGPTSQRRWNCKGKLDQVWCLPSRFYGVRPLADLAKFHCTQSLLYHHIRKLAARATIV